MDYRRTSAQASPDDEIDGASDALIKFRRAAVANPREGEQDIPTRLDLELRFFSVGVDCSSKQFSRYETM